MPRLKSLLVAGSIACWPLQAFAQTPGSSTSNPGQSPAAAEVDAGRLATPIAHEVTFSVAAYEYVEPGDTSISIHGPKLGAGYVATFALNARRHWFLQGQAQGLAGRTTYDGWCAPFVITPESRSPNGYALDLGGWSPCSESGDEDWYVEGRALVGKDFIGRNWAWSPNVGVGIRHLSNGTTGIPGYRTDAYLYLPAGMTARTLVASNHLLSVHVEYDHLLHGWQNTYGSRLGGGDVPATPTAPAFTIDGLSDISFDQHSGWGLRAGAKYQFSKRWSVEPEYIHWNVSDSAANDLTATFTVGGITARQQIGAYEPLNSTNEFVMRVGFRF